MSGTVECSRCGRSGAALSSPPLPGGIGSEIQAHVCADCWHEWQQMEVMVINELRLNFMDPRSQEVLEHHMREFFGLPARPGAEASGPSS